MALLAMGCGNGEGDNCAVPGPRVPVAGARGRGGEHVGSEVRRRETPATMKWVSSAPRAARRGAYGLVGGGILVSHV